METKSLKLLYFFNKWFKSLSARNIHHRHIWCTLNLRLITNERLLLSRRSLHLDDFVERSDITLSRDKSH